jgi:hypothetical protein
MHLKGSSGDTWSNLQYIAAMKGVDIRTADVCTCTEAMTPLAPKCRGAPPERCQACSICLMSSIVCFQDRFKKPVRIRDMKPIIGVIICIFLPENDGMHIRNALVDVEK